MPQTIYMPQKNLFNSQVWGQMMPQLISQMAMAKFKQKMAKDLRDSGPAGEPDMVRGEKFYWKYDHEQNKHVMTDVPVPKGEVGGPKFEGLTIYGTGPNAGKTRRIYPEKGIEPELPKDWTFRPTQRPTLSEREIERKRNAIGKLRDLGAEGAYMIHGFKVNEDKTLYVDPVNNAPVKLPPHNKVLKRGLYKTAVRVGEQWDDTKELMALLKDPEVENNLKLAESDGLWNRVGSKWSNQVQHWMQKKGIGRNSKTATAIARMQRLASEERKAFMGVAVTELEMRSSLGWMPSAGDSLDTMLNKTALMEKEGEQEFRRFLDIYKDVADMSPFYKAFGIPRFGEVQGGVTEMSDKELLRLLGR